MENPDGTTGACVVKNMLAMYLNLVKNMLAMYLNLGTRYIASIFLTLHQRL